MSLWNGILQAVHSAMIDELNARWPDDKLELGLPKRVEGWALSARAETALARRVRCTEGKGWVVIGTTAAQDAKETRTIFEGLVIRATREFKIRSLDARFEGWLEEPITAQTTIWLPISLLGHLNLPVYDLAVALQG